MRTVNPVQVPPAGHHGNGAAHERRAMEHTSLDDSGRIDRLRRFVSPQVARVALARDGWRTLARQRARLSIVFCDLRGFTAFAERVDVDEGDRFLVEYHARLEDLLHRYDATLDHRAGDGVMAFIGAPIPIVPEGASVLRAVSMALDIRTTVSDLVHRWHGGDNGLGIGIGVNHGDCTVGRLGSRWRVDYSATGRPVNIAARLCDAASDGQILVPRDVAGPLACDIRLQPLSAMCLKGVTAPVEVVNVCGRARLRGTARVVDGGPSVAAAPAAAPARG